jgi:hypothetical protein
MDLKTLKVGNELYGLGLSEEDIQKIEKVLKTNVLGDHYVVKAKGKVYGVSYQSYSNRNDIVVKPVKEVPVVPSKNIFGYIVSFEINDKDTPPINYLCGTILSSDSFDKNESKNITSLPQLKESIKRRMLRNSGSYSLKEISSDNVSHFFWLFDEKMPEKFSNAKQHACKDQEIRKILKVWEYDNTRFSLSLSKSFRDDGFMLKLFKHGDERYNFIDEGRLFYDRTYIWDDLNEDEVDVHFLQKCRRGQYEFALVNKKLYEETKRRFKLKVKKEKEEKELREIVKTEAEKRLKNLKFQNILVNGIKFNAKGIFLGDQQISGTFDNVDRWGSVNSMTEFIQKKVDFNHPENIDFNRIYETFCDELVGRTFDGILGSISVNVTTETKTNKEGTDFTKWFINGIRINKDEVRDMLIRAVCFDKSADYIDLLKKVSKCSLKFHDAINGGVRISLRDNTFSTEHDNGRRIVKLLIEREANCNFLVVGKKKFRMSDSNRIINKSDINKVRRYDTMTIDEMIELFTTKGLFTPTMTTSDVASMLKEGFKEHMEAIKKSEELLKGAIKSLKITETQHEGNTAYLVQGVSGKKYILTKGLQIYDADKKGYICVVDKTPSKSTFLNDKLVARMYALANDKLVARQIHTLNV